MWDGFDKRRFPRLSVRCEIKIFAGDKSPALQAVTENVGRGGVCVILERELQRFRPCRLRLEWDKKSRLECDGRVVWVVKSKDIRAKKVRFDTGIEFTRLSEEGRSRLEEHLKENSDG
jgi:hypothetical protein